MKDNAIVSNMLNRTSVIVKSNKASVVSNRVDKERECFSLDSTGIEPINLEVNNTYSSRKKCDYILAISKNKIENQEVFCLETKAPVPATLIKFRYIRDWLNGSNENSGNHWVEIQVIDKNTGTNLALNKPVTSGDVAVTLANPTYVTDGSTVSGNYSYTSAYGLQSIVIDLQQECDLKDVDIKIWHFYTDGRTYNGTKTEISEDKTQWITLRDSRIKGKYPETSSGITIDPNSIDYRENFLVGLPIPLPTPNDEAVIISKFNIKESLITSVSDLSALNKDLEQVTAKSRTIHDNIAVENVFTTSKDKKQNNYYSSNNYNYASMIVKTKIPVNTGGSGGSTGEGLKAIDLELQPMSYMKMALDFTGRKVVNVIGLPPGLKIVNNTIKGSPVMAGNYNIKVILDDSTFVHGKIKVHVLDRVL